MNLMKVYKPIYNVLTQTTSFPYTPEVQLSGLAIVNDGADTVTVVVDDGFRDITINCTTNSRSYDADFRAIKTIDVTSGTTYQIELRAVL